MGQEAHRKWQEYINAKEEMKSREEIETKRLEWLLQKMEDEEDFQKGSKLLDWANGRD